MITERPEYIYIVNLHDTNDGAQMPILAFATLAAAETFTTSGEKLAALAAVNPTFQYRIVAMLIHK